MNGQWRLETSLNGNYAVTKWNTQEGAIADRERLLRVHRVKDSSSPTGWRTVIPIGWTAIRRVQERR
jgi:hypothetical protein